MPFVESVVVVDVEVVALDVLLALLVDETVEGTPTLADDDEGASSEDVDRF
jgi:hypothetical protein